MSKRNEMTKEVIQLIKKEAFVKGYNPMDVEAMGLLVSNYFEWDGKKIVEAFINALEDANFHSMADKVMELFDEDLK